MQTSVCKDKVSGNYEYCPLQQLKKNKNQLTKNPTTNKMSSVFYFSVIIEEERRDSRA